MKLAEHCQNAQLSGITEMANGQKFRGQTIYQKHFKSYEEIVDFTMDSIDTTINEQFLLFEKHNLSIEVFFSVLFKLYKYRIGFAVYSTSAVLIGKLFTRKIFKLAAKHLLT